MVAAETMPLAARFGRLTLALVPVSIGVGRLWYLYVAPAPGIPYPYRSVAVTPSDALVLLTCVGWLAWRVRTPSRLPLPPGIKLIAASLALLALVAVGTVGAAVDPLIALGVSVQLALLALFFIAASELIASFSVRPLVIGIALAVVAESLLVVWQTAAQTTAPAGVLFNGWAGEQAPRAQGASVVIIPIVGRWLRAYGTLAHPNILGGFLVLSLAMLVFRRDARTRNVSAVLALGFLAVLLTFSRSAWLALLLGAAAVLLMARDIRPSLPKMPARIIVVVAAAAFVLVALVRVESLGSLVERNSIDTRGFYNAVAWRVIGHGVPVGAGNLVLAQQHLLGAADAGSEPVHDVFVITLAELGPFGLVAWVAVVGSLLLASWLRRGDPPGRAGPMVAVLVLAPLLVFDHYLWTQPAGRVLAVLTLVELTSGLRAHGVRAASVAATRFASPVTTARIGDLPRRAMPA
jgi:hypothetical protein